MNSNNRVILVDFIRGFALMGIVLIHCIEHFDFFHNPDFHFFFSAQTDQKVMDWVFLLISGKAYSIFALMFGFSFFIQMSRQEAKGIDFRGRFAWRLTILLIIGFFHSLLYQGDILHIYALLGFILIALHRVGSKYLLWLSVILALQIPLLFHLIKSFAIPSYEYISHFGGNYWQEGNNAFANGSFIDVISFNFWKGRYDIWGWTVNNGRWLQLIALFIAGLLIGRKQYFADILNYKKNVLKLTLISTVVIAILLIANNIITNIHLTNFQHGLIDTLMKSYINLAFTAFIILVLILFYLKFKDANPVVYLATFGRMSLSNYLIQAIIGVILFYGYGFGLYHYLGSTWSLIYGFLFLSAQLAFSKYWLSNYRYGPFEWFWRACTYLDFSIKNKLTGTSK